MAPVLVILACEPAAVRAPLGKAGAVAGHVTQRSPLSASGASCAACSSGGAHPSRRPRSRHPGRRQRRCPGGSGGRGSRADHGTCGGLHAVGARLPLRPRPHHGIKGSEPQQGEGGRTQPGCPELAECPAECLQGLRAECRVSRLLLVPVTAGAGHDFLRYSVRKQWMPE